MSDVWIIPRVPGYCDCGRQEGSCAECQTIPAGELAMNALRWLSDRIMNCDIDRIPASTAGIVAEYRQSSRCERDDPSWFLAAGGPHA